MHFLQVLPLALSASAFLVPAEINNPFDVVKKLPDYAKVEEVQLECDGGCSVGAFKTSDVEHYVLGAKLAIKDGVVTFNSAPIWPPTSSELLKAAMISTKANEGAKVEVPISTQIEYRPAEILADEHTSMKIHPVVIDILALEDKVVHVESLEVRVAETEAGLGLLPSRIRAYEASPYTDACTNVWCRVKGVIAQKFSEWRQAATKKMQSYRGGCAGRKGVHGHKGMPLRGGPAKFGPGSTLHPEGGFRGHHKGPHPHGPHAHHHHQRHSLLAHLFRTFIVGAFAGSMLGMVAFVFVQAIRRIRGSSTVDYVVVEQVEAEEGRASVDGPPKYDEVYREAQYVSEDEKKELLQ